MTLKGSPFIMETIKRKVNKPNTTHMEDTVFALKQTIAKLRHESHAKDGVITCLKQDIVDLQDRLKETEKWVCGWSPEDVLHKADEMSVSITEREAEEILGSIEHNFDANVGVFWDTIEWEIEDHVKRRERNEVRN
ncbi:MAG: hypothetical protein Unbinned4294contig1001_47 [Prokaryotic dsDNA virus sp.]|nr:MAG: hypothetical protein Unbinned4294contig1001_47 [Prokaryotic dsDNA virus sp.]